MKPVVLSSFRSVWQHTYRSRSARRYGMLPSLILVLPLILTLSVGFFYPVARLIGMSFTGAGSTYGRFVSESLYLNVLVTTLTLSAAVAGLCLILGYPVAYAMTRARPWLLLVITGCVFIPLWTSVLIRSYAWIVLLQKSGLVNAMIVATGLSEQPLKLLHTQGAVVVAMTHVLLPFAILPIYSTLKSLPSDLTRASASLGATRLGTFLFVIFPLSLPGVFAATILTFVLALGFYITPALVGGPGSMLMATLIGQQTTVVLDWPFAAALSTILLGLTLAVVMAFQRMLMFSKGFSGVY